MGWKKKSSIKKADWRFATLITSPALFVILIIGVFPISYALILSFFKYELALPVPVTFIGLENYKRIFTDTRFWNALRVTLIIVTGGVSIQLLTGLGTALLLNQEFRGRSAIVSILLIPSIIAPVVVGFIFRMLLNDRYGPINYILLSLHLQKIPWLSKATASMIGVMLANGWEWFPFMMLVLLAGLQSIPQSQLEAADIDGAGEFQKFLYVVLPNLWNIILVVVLIRAIEDFKVFDLIWVITGGGPGIATETMNIYTYKQGFSFWSIGYALSLAMVQTLLTFSIIRYLFGRLRRSMGAA